MGEIRCSTVRQKDASETEEGLQNSDPAIDPACARKMGYNEATRKLIDVNEMTMLWWEYAK